MVTWRRGGYREERWVQGGEVVIGRRGGYREERWL